MLLTQDLELLGTGTQKFVYQHPSEPNLVIKVIKPSRVGDDGGFVEHQGLRRSYSQGVYRQFRREILQYMQLCKNNYKEKRFIFPIETPHGFIATDQGLGFITEKIIGPSGKGESLVALCLAGEFQNKHAHALKQFFDDCCDLHIVFGEVNRAGIMYTESRNARPEFVLVDGIGEKLFFPIRSMSKSISNRYIRKVERKNKKILNIEYPLAVEVA